MKKKIIFLCIGTLVIIGIVVKGYKNTHRSINSLMTQLETAINSGDKSKLLNCYPDFLNEKLDNYLAEDSMQEFHNKVGDIKVSNVKVVSKMDLIDAKELQTDIFNEYNTDVSLSDYQFITFLYHDNFAESTMQVIKIGNKYYLYGAAPLGDPIQYFVK